MPSTDGEVTKKLRRLRSKSVDVKQLVCSYCRSTKVDPSTLTCSDCGTSTAREAGLPSRFGRKRDI